MEGWVIQRLREGKASMRDNWGGVVSGTTKLQVGVMERIGRPQERVGEHAKRIKGAIALATTAADFSDAPTHIAGLGRNPKRAQAQASCPVR